MKLTGQMKQHIQRLRQLIVGKKSENNSKLLSDKFSSELSSIPELNIYIDNKDPMEKKIILGELGAFIQLKEYNKGHFFRRIYESNEDFIMLLKGKIMEFEIKYVNKIMSFKEYILFVIKLYILNEKFLYYDCIEKNKEAFPFNIFKYFIYNSTSSFEIPEEEKNINDKKWIKDINIVDICKELNIKNFEFKIEYEKLKNHIQSFNWNNFNITNNLKLTEEEYSNIFEEFFNIYNLYLNTDNANDNKNNNEEVTYKVCLPYFYKKRIIEPISFIGDLNRPIQRKNYSAFLCLNNCFIIYVDKIKLSPIRPLYKYIYNNKKNYITQNLFTKHYLFDNVNIDYLSKFGKYMQLIKLNKDEILFKQGEPNKGVYIVMKGNIQLESYQSYKDLIDINFLFLHSLDYCPNYISNNKIKELEPNLYRDKKNKSYLSGYYDYNSNLNKIMKSSIFQTNSKIKENIIFTVYNKNDIVGLGETFDYKYKINIFTAKSLNNDTELIFIPNEIFQALLSIESIYNKLGLATEEKTKILTACIDKYKNNFEKKIEMIINKEQIKLFKKKINNFRILFNDIKKPGLTTKNNNYNIESSPHKIIDNLNNQSQTSENEKSYISKFENNNIVGNRETNETNFIKEYNSQNINILKKPMKNNFKNRKKLFFKNSSNLNNNSDFTSKLFFHPKINKHTMINRRNYFMNSAIYSKENNDNNDIRKRMEDISNFYYQDIKSKRLSQPMFISYDFNSENIKSNVINNKYKKNKKINLRSFSAKKTDEQLIKKNIIEYQIKTKERNKYYNNNNLSGNTYTNKIKPILMKKNSLNKSSTNNNFNKLKILNTKKIIINQFNSTTLFTKNRTTNNKSKSNS